MLCDTCKSIFAGVNMNTQFIIGADEPFKGHHRTIEDLYLAAAEQCQICTQLFRNWKRNYWDTYVPHDEEVSAQEKELTMIAEVIESQESFQAKRDSLSSPLAEEDYLSSYSFQGLDGDLVSTKQLEQGAPALFFASSREYFKTSRKLIGSPYQGWTEGFVTIPAERKWISLLQGLHTKLFHRSAKVYFDAQHLQSR
jgi:hypothetical protein